MPTRGSQSVAFAIRGPITRADLPGLCKRVCSALPGSGEFVACDVAGIDPDAVTVDALARLQLAARRRGCCVELRNASVELLELVELMGLTHVLAAPGLDLARSCVSSPVECSLHGRLHTQEPG